MKRILLSISLIIFGVLSEGKAAPVIPALNSRITNLTTIPNSNLTIALRGNTYTWSGDGPKNCNSVELKTTPTVDGRFNFKSLKTKSCGFLNTISYDWQLYLLNPELNYFNIYWSNKFETSALTNFTLLESPVLKFPLILSDASSAKIWASKAHFPILSLSIIYKNQIVGSFKARMSNPNSDTLNFELENKLAAVIGNLENQEVQIEVKLYESYAPKEIYFSSTDTIAIDQLSEYIKELKIVVNPIQ